MSGLLSPDTGYFRLFSLFSSWRASARLRLKKKKFLENFSVAGACSFHGAYFCHNDKEAAVNTQRIYKAFAKVRAEIRPSKPTRVRVYSAYAVDGLLLCKNLYNQNATPRKFLFNPNPFSVFYSFYF